MKLRLWTLREGAAAADPLSKTNPCEGPDCLHTVCDDASGTTIKGSKRFCRLSKYIRWSELGTHGRRRHALASLYMYLENRLSPHKIPRMENIQTSRVSLPSFTSIPLYPPSSNIFYSNLSIKYLECPNKNIPSPPTSQFHPAPQNHNESLHETQHPPNALRCSLLPGLREEYFIHHFRSRKNCTTHFRFPQLFLSKDT